MVEEAAWAGGAAEEAGGAVEEAAWAGGVAEEAVSSGAVNLSLNHAEALEIPPLALVDH